MKNGLQGANQGRQVMQTMQNLAHSMDSTRLCTAAINGSWGGTNGFTSVIDVQGFNYNLSSLDSYHSGHSSLNIIGTETASTVTTRGIYTNDTVNGYVASYDFITQSGLPNPVTWGEMAETWWPFYDSRPWSSGGFCWTGFDYRGEPTPYDWPCINSHFGIMDTCGFPKDLFYYYQANWSPKTVLHLFPHWNWATPGQIVNVWAFGNCQSVELFTNGVSLGRQTLNVQSHVEWNVPYAAGTLQAIGYNNGVAVITNIVETTEAPAEIALWPDRSTILADGRDVSVVTVAILDSQGRVVPTATNNVSFTVSGGAIIGVGNGNPSSHEADKASQRAVFNGLAEVIVQSTNQPGSITLTATSTGLISTNVTITEAATLPAPAAPTGVAAAAGNSRVVVSWDVVPGATTYNLERATVNGGPYTITATNLGSLGYTDSNVTNFTTYYYVVSANGNDTSFDSAEVGATPSAIASGLTAIANNGQILLNWNGSPGANYNVKRSTVTGGPYTVMAAATTTTNYTDTNTAVCQTYYYVVTITNAGNESLNSIEVSAELPGALPPQLQSTDIGSVGFVGSASFCSGEFTISGSGADIWGTADAFQFVYAPMNGDGKITVRVVSVQNTDPWAKAGVMIRETPTAGSRNVYALQSYGNGVGVQYRTNTTAGLNSSHNYAGTAVTAPYWLQLTRTGNVFRAYSSPNGLTWTQIGKNITNDMASSVYTGIAVTAHNNSAINTSLLDNFSASFITNVLPSISLISPTNNQTFIQPKAITLAASASDADGTVSNVTFFNGTSLLGTVTNGIANLYSLLWNNVTPASYSLSTVATDNSGATNLSTTVNILVQPLILQVSGSQTNGQFRLTFQGQNGQNYMLETSTNLVNWISVLTDAPMNGLLIFTDTNATDAERFYRVRQ